MQVNLTEISGKWSFIGESTNDLTHGIHPYPGRMPPQIAKSLVAKYSKEHQRVLDPFCGSGTVLLESMLAGRTSYGCDINALAVLISRVKTTTLGAKDLGLCVEQAIGLLAEAERHSGFGLLPGEPLDEWFQHENLREVSVLVTALHKRKNKIPMRVYRVLALSLAYTVRKSSYQRWREFKRYRIQAEKRAAYKVEVFDVFRRQVLEMVSKLGDLHSSINSRPPNHIIPPEIRCCDVKRLSLEHPVSLIATSPPYGDSRTTIAYDEFSSLASPWLELLGFKSKKSVLLDESNPIEKCSGTLSAKLDRIEKIDQHRAKDVRTFYSDLYSNLVFLRSLLGRNGTLAMVVGGRTIRGIVVPMDKVVEELCADIGFRQIARFGRVITSKTQPLRNRNSNTINLETVEVFSKN